MDKQTLIQGLIEIIEDKMYLVDETDPECPFKADIEYLEEAIRIIEEAPEVPVREQTKEIELKVDKFKKIQCALFIIQTLIIVMFSIMLIKEKKYIDELLKQLDIFKNLLSNF